MHDTTTVTAVLIGPHDTCRAEEDIGVDPSESEFFSSDSYIDTDTCGAQALNKSDSVPAWTPLWQIELAQPSGLPRRLLS